MPKSSVELMLEMENDLILLLIKYLGKGDMEAATWQYDKLSQLGVFRGKATQITKASAGEILATAQSEVAKYATTRAKMIDERMPADRLADAVPIAASETIRATIAEYETSTRRYMTSAIDTMLASAGTEYVQTVDKVMTARSIKGLTGREAISQIATEWAQGGLTSFVDKAGKHWSTEAYAQTIVRTQSTQAAYQAQSARLDELDQDLIEVSSHIGARPGCAPYQGKVYSRSGKDPHYPALSTTSIGDAAGLFGVNCGHNQYPYFPGTKKTYSPYNEKENKESYQTSQRQRLLERNIRKAKRDVDYQRKVGTEEAKRKANKRLKLRQSQMRSFITDTGRTRRRGREQIYG
jgi:hypothetical protein